MRQNLRSSPPRSRGSALILVLLMIVLLATIAVSFLSTARVEQIATGNFTRQTAARGLADMATGEAMAKIAEGFTTTNTNATTVTISQPGLIRSFEFTGNGTPTVKSKELFPTTNLVSGTYFNINTNGIVTGNPAETLDVPWQTITNAAGQTNGRVTYYVDDEGTKLNLNRAVSTRDTLNASGRRPLDIGAMEGADTDEFEKIIAGKRSGTTNIASWVHFFRPEQAVGAGVVATNQVPLVATAVSANSNSPTAKTAWGADRLYINELPVTSASVTNIHEALTGPDLTTIFQGNFTNKYKELGLKQIAANMLQMRTPGATNVEFWFTNKAPLLGADNLDTNGIPKEYLGYAPYPMISEVGFSYKFTYGVAGDATVTTNAAGVRTTNINLNFLGIRPNIQPTVELYNPYPFDFYFPTNAYPRLVVKLRKFTFDISYSISNGPVQTQTIVTGTKPAYPFKASSTVNFAFNPQVQENWSFGDKMDDFCPTNTKGAYIPAGARIQTHLMYINWGMRVDLDVDTNAFAKTLTNMFTVTALKNAKMEVEYVRLLSGLSTNNYNTNDVLSGFTNTIRDWLTGDQIGSLQSDLQTNPVNLPCPVGVTVTLRNGKPIVETVDKGTAGPSFKTPWTPPRLSGSPAPVPTETAQRLSFLTKLPVLAATNYTNWNVGPATWVASNSSYFGQQGIGRDAWATPNTAASKPSAMVQAPFASDPSFSDNVANAVYADTNNATRDMRPPILLTGSFTSPSDLGLVPTSVPYRRLRMQVQPAAESAAGLIPDWAMLEVISFGPQAAGAGILDQIQPVNLNGKFHVPQGIAPAARDIGLKSLAKVLDSAPNNITNKLADPMSGKEIDFKEDLIKFWGEWQDRQNDAGTVVTNIGAMTWSDDSEWADRREDLGFPEDAYLLASEIMEIAGVADSVSATDYNNTSSHFKWNEGRASALLPAVDTRSSHFMIYACAQTLDKQGEVQSEALTKTLVEVYEDPNNAGTYKVKKLYTEPIRVE